MKNPIWIIDDDEFIRLSLNMLLEDEYESIIQIAHPNTIIEHLNRSIPSVVLLDMNFTDGDHSGKEGLYWLELILKHSPNSSVIPVTAYGEVDMAVNALKMGAADFITKPWKNEKLVSTVRMGTKLFQEKAKVQVLQEKETILLNDFTSREKVVRSSSPSMLKIYEVIEKVANTDAEVLITGENGTGKEVIAQMIHDYSDRHSKGLFQVDLGSIHDTLFESELFGHVKGAFTDAHTDRMGKMEIADGGTLFLDEIGNMKPEHQSKLLSVLQKKEVVRVGTNTPKSIDIRLICATNADIKDQVNQGQFREDLFFRINTIEIHLPPLRERKEDIMVLAQAFLERFNLKYSKDLNFDATATTALESYTWPGNIRELQHVIERSVILASDTEIAAHDLGIQVTHEAKEASFDDYHLEKLEEWAIRKTLDKHRGHVSNAANELGLSRGALYRRMEKYGI